MHPLGQQQNFLLKVFHLEVIGPNPPYQGLQGDVAHNQAQNQGKSHAQTDLPGFGEDQQQHGAGNPEDAAVTEQGDDGHNDIQDIVFQIGLNPVQNRKVKGYCQLV